MKMQKAAVSQALVDTCAFAVVRVPTVERGIEIAEGLAEGGVHAMEISYTLPNAGEVIAAIRELWSQQLLVLLSWLALSSLLLTAALMRLLVCVTCIRFLTHLVVPQ